MAEAGTKPQGVDRKKPNWVPGGRYLQRAHALAVAAAGLAHRREVDSSIREREPSQVRTIDRKQGQIVCWDIEGRAATVSNTPSTLWVIRTHCRREVEPRQVGQFPEEARLVVLKPRTSLKFADIPPTPEWLKTSELVGIHGPIGSIGNRLPGKGHSFYQAGSRDHGSKSLSGEFD
ncbi:uncharacterized protein EI90DRAFT_3012106 [Cantharellus anzutake]|uniref:uncharacterized protein n=1 Tax=Cantharellus anzutake TaxID=1750568 RepID=UPI00190886DB|nr:uncharacterized protein EI90DRAFT_3012106 [Cantharellus anzutake]KAF8341561.1 hypothetical protein EI90DRAFT_3012106 [Cantharellus anzutake]